MATITNLATDLAIELGAALKARGFVLALAESCTGGMLAEAVTSVAGSSAWFDRGFVTYSNQSKIEMLNVSSETLKKFGAVSEETANEMALGALERSHAHIAGSITGIAGPDGGSAEKPIGTVCFAWATLNQITRNQTIKNQPASVSTQHFTGNRQQIRQQAAAFLMQQLIQSLN